MILLTKVHLIFNQKTLISASFAVELIKQASPAFPALAIRIFFTLIHVLALTLIQHILLINVIGST